jgi:hypothetical protein
MSGEIIHTAIKDDRNIIQSTMMTEKSMKCFWCTATNEDKRACIDNIRKYMEKDNNHQAVIILLFVVHAPPDVLKMYMECFEDHSMDFIFTEPDIVKYCSIMNTYKQKTKPEAYYQMFKTIFGKCDNWIIIELLIDLKHLDSEFFIDELIEWAEEGWKNGDDMWTGAESPFTKIVRDGLYEAGIDKKVKNIDA